MSGERVKTGGFLGAAAVLAALAAYVEPESARPEIFSDQGEVFFENFRDVTAVQAIEVVDYNEAEAVARPLKVELRKGRWVISSHSDYPAEARDRMAKTAAELVDLKKDIVVSDSVEEHARYGVIDPLDARNPSLTGRGKRITLRGAQGDVLAEMVLGQAVKERAGYRYARLPGQKRTYAVKTAADPSARFEDWVESNVLRIAAGEVTRMVLNSYSIDEQLGRLSNVVRIVMTRGDKDEWRVEPPGRPTRGEIQQLVAALAGLRVVGARPKPAELSRQLKARQLQMTLETVMSLRQRGFFISPDGRLLAKQGELQVETSRGLLYSLRFGELVAGSTGKSDAASEAKTGETSAPRLDEDRYLFVTVTFNPKASPGSEGAMADQRLAGTLDARFADWYYVIRGSDFAKLSLKNAAAAATPPPRPAPPQ
jgi:hypothetical protein